jgi:hypothetical protein
MIQRQLHDTHVKKHTCFIPQRFKSHITKQFQLTTLLNN